MINVLVFPGGTEAGLEIHKSLCRCKEVRLFSAGDARSSHAPFLFARHFQVPNVEEAEWIEGLNRVVVEHNIDYIYPAYDDVIVALALHQASLAAPIVSSPLKTCLVTRSKAQTYDVLKDCLPVPRRYHTPREIREYPVFVKPDRGQGAQDTHIVDDSRQLEYVLSQATGHAGEYLVLEYLPGDEFTVDCFSDREKGLLYCGARTRVRTRAGIAMRSCPVRDQIFEEYAKIISKRLEFHGAWFFQMKQDGMGRCKLLEVAPRIGGTSALQRVGGVNLPLLSLYEQERRPIEILTNERELVIDRALTNRYHHHLRYRRVYVDLDDTLILNDRVNTQLISLLYQCVNRGVHLVLITKHAGDLDAALQKHRLSGLFDQVIHLSAGEAKADGIEPEDAIFIDDSFRERKAVKERLGIPTFDVSMIEALLDDRC